MTQWKEMDRWKKDCIIFLIIIVVVGGGVLLCQYFGNQEKFKTQKSPEFNIGDVCVFGIGDENIYKGTVSEVLPSQVVICIRYGTNDDGTPVCLQSYIRSKEDVTKVDSDISIDCQPGFPGCENAYKYCSNLHPSCLNGDCKDQGNCIKDQGGTTICKCSTDKDCGKDGKCLTVYNPETGKNDKKVCACKSSSDCKGPNSYCVGDVYGQRSSYKFNSNFESIPKYSCNKAGQSVSDPNGKYHNSTCDFQCTSNQTICDDCYPLPVKYNLTPLPRENPPI